MKLRCVLVTVGLIFGLNWGSIHGQEKAPAQAEIKPVVKSPKPTDVVIRVGKESVTFEQWQALERGLPPQYKQACDQMGKRQCANQFGLIVGLAREAEHQKLDQSADFKDQLAFARMQLLMQMAFKDLNDRNQLVTEAEVKKYYEAHAAEYVELKLRGIFVSLSPPVRPGKDDAKDRTDEQAKQLAASLRKKIIDGADFATVAKESSDEQSTATKGGDFGSVRKGQLPPRIEQAVMALKVNEVSEPVQEARGYYLFKVEERKTTTVDEATPEIRSKLQQEKVMGALEKVKAEYVVKCADDFCGPETPAAAAPAAPAPPPVKK